MKTTNNLPKYWVVQCNTSNPNWKKVIDYLHKVHGYKWEGGCNGEYYGYDGNTMWSGTNTYSNICFFENSPTLLTIEEFVEMTEGFVLPEKWCIKRDDKNDKIVTDFINNYSESSHCYLRYNPENPYLHYVKKSVSSNNKPWNNYTEITFEQFKKYVMKDVTPEYVECINTNTASMHQKYTGKSPEVGKIYKVIETSYPEKGAHVLTHVTECGVTVYTHATKPSTKEAFDKQQQKPKETMKTITHTQAQQIIDIACPKWKGTLSERWGKHIVLKQSIAITEESYQEMRKACTSEQNKLFDDIFGEDVKFKVGDWVYIGEVSHRWNSIVQLTKDSDKSFGYAKTKQGDETWFNVEFIERHATEEEIQKAKYIPKGTPCLVRDNIESWKFAYSIGDGRFTTGAGYGTWEQVQVLDINNLPKF